MNKQVTDLVKEKLSSEKQVRIKLLGDSITHGVGGTGFEQNGEKIVLDFARNPDGYCWAKLFKEYMEAHYNCVVTNNACTGTNIDFVIQQFDVLVDAEDDLVICTIGTNNRHKYFKSAEEPRPDRDEFFNQVREKIVALAEKFKAAGKDVIFVANIPAGKENEKDGADYFRVIHMADIRDAYVSVSAEMGFPLISLYDVFSRTCLERGIDFETLLDDNLHPNDAGYDLMFELIVKELGLA